jgi:hypothetical protein
MEIPSTNRANDAQVERLVQSLVRGRLIFLILAVVVPAGCYGAFERQARRLDALGDHGAPATATVTALAQGGTIEYAYEVGGRGYTWNVAQGEAPGTVGKTFTVIYLPEDPTLSRPGNDRSRATREAASNRSFAWKVEAAIFAFFAFNLILCDVRLRRLRKTGQTEWTDARAYRTRLVLTGAMLVPVLVLMFGWHLADSRQRGESVWPVVLGVATTVGVIGGTGFYVLREGRVHAAARSDRVLRWALPLATTIAVLRLAVWLIGRR